MYHVKEYPHPVEGNLDLNIADEEEFSPDKLRSNLERIYLTVGISVVSCGKHLARIRSWREKSRTAGVLAVYSLAWFLDMIVPIISLLLVVLVVYPPSRDTLFPPAPIALVSSTTGGLQTPKAGVLGSNDSVTGATERHKGEAVETEASNFVDSIAHIAFAITTGKDPQMESATQDGGSPDSHVPDPTSVADSASNARTPSTGGAAYENDTVKIPMEAAAWNKTRPIMHALSDIADTWERFGNALSPKPPFPHTAYRLQLAAILVPIFVFSPFISSYMVVKAITAGIGFSFFANPLITRGVDWLNGTYPKWQEVIELRNSVLKGVPSNAQLTLTLLRIGEVNKTPLPPPPHSTEPLPDKSIDATDEHLRDIGSDHPLNASAEDIKAVIAHDPNTVDKTTGSDVAASKQQGHDKKGSRLLGMVKSTVKSTVRVGLRADHLKARIGSGKNAKERIGVIPDKRVNLLSGPTDFQCRYDGRKGHVYVSTRATTPCLAFALDKHIATKGSADCDPDPHPIWSIAVDDIKELKKVKALGW